MAVKRLAVQPCEAITKSLVALRIAAGAVHEAYQQAGPNDVGELDAARRLLDLVEGIVGGVDRVPLDGPARAIVHANPPSVTLESLLSIAKPAPAPAAVTLHNPIF